MQSQGESIDSGTRLPRFGTQANYDYAEDLIDGSVTKCKIRFILVRFNCKGEKSGVQKWMEIMPIGVGGAGGVRRLIANAMLDFHLF